MGRAVQPCGFRAPHPAHPRTAHRAPAHRASRTIEAEASLPRALYAKRWGVATPLCVERLLCCHQPLRESACDCACLEGWWCHPRLVGEMLQRAELCWYLRGRAVQPLAAAAAAATAAAAAATRRDFVGQNASLPTRCDFVDQNAPLPTRCDFVDQNASLPTKFRSEGPYDERQQAYQCIRELPPPRGFCADPHCDVHVVASAAFRAHFDAAMSRALLGLTWPRRPATS